MVVVALPTMEVVVVPTMEVLPPPSPHLAILHSTSTLLRILSPPLRRRWQSLIEKKRREVEELIPHQELTELQGLGREKGIVTTESSPLDAVLQVCAGLLIGDHAPPAPAHVGALSSVVVDAFERWQTFLRRQRRRGERGSALRGS